eukprot:jgi/Ulvmu1/12594/UM092_0024.1
MQLLGSCSLDMFTRTHKNMFEHVRKNTQEYVRTGSPSSEELFLLLKGSCVPQWQVVNEGGERWTSTVLKANNVDTSSQVVLLGMCITVTCAQSLHQWHHH